MTKEELEKEVEEWLSKNWTPYDFYDTECNVYNDDIKDDLIEAYLAGTEPREKRIAELEAQIEKMKCPQNCKNGSVYNWSDNSICMDCEKVRSLHEDNWQEMCKGCKYWELRR